MKVPIIFDENIDKQNTKCKMHKKTITLKYNRHFRNLHVESHT